MGGSHTPQLPHQGTAQQQQQAIAQYVNGMYHHMHMMQQQGQSADPGTAAVPFYPPPISHMGYNKDGLFASQMMMVPPPPTTAAPPAAVTQQGSSVSPGSGGVDPNELTNAIHNLGLATNRNHHPNMGF